jgi:hypothetical protein
MECRPEVRRLLHDVQAKSASLKSASELLKDSPDGETLEMLDLMTKEARDILKCLHALRKGIASRPEAC